MLQVKGIVWSKKGMEKKKIIVKEVYFNGSDVPGEKCRWLLHVSMAPASTPALLTSHCCAFCLLHCSDFLEWHHRDLQDVINRLFRLAGRCTAAQWCNQPEFGTALIFHHVQLQCACAPLPELGSTVPQSIAAQSPLSAGLGSESSLTAFPNMIRAGLYQILQGDFSSILQKNKHTDSLMNEVPKVTADQKKIPAPRMTFLLYLSPRYPKKGAASM